MRRQFLKWADSRRDELGVRGLVAPHKVGNNLKSKVFLS